MAQTQVSNEEFLDRLSQLFASSSQKHSVFVSHKRVTKGQGGSSTGDEGVASYPVVVRATDGAGKTSRSKFTTHVESDKLQGFQDAYSTLLRTSLAAFLKKRDKAKERRMDKVIREKRKRMEETAATARKVTAIGSKRGTGRRKRQQAAKKAAQLRKEQSRVQRQGRSAAAAATS